MRRRAAEMLAEQREFGRAIDLYTGVIAEDNPRLEDIARVTGQNVGEIRLLHTRLVGGRVSLREFANGDCTFLDPRTRKCRVYEARPRQCRSWPFWRSNLDTPESWEAVKAVCPGAGCGAFVGLDEIEARLR